ncbi:toll-like receptor 4 [Protopterus annectens]|uniref:toll-like receptor 4 n=1 Tax=Protopterus annectens TaxID=7888 RepID=UPI001CFA9C7B|nr:toll-like receptor 4 [Protopterus annectens]
MRTARISTALFFSDYVDLFEDKLGKLPLVYSMKSDPEIVPGISYSCMGKNLSQIPLQIANSTENLDFSFNYLPKLFYNMFSTVPNLQHLDLTSKDEEWVMEELVENLENTRPALQLCLHVRDFLAGLPITSNIIQEGLMRSKKVIVVVSKNFVLSKWCNFEFEMAQSWQFVEGKPRIIIIVLDEIEKEFVSKILGLHKYIRKNTYLKWKDNDIMKHLFWRRLRKALLEGNI